MSWKVVSNSWQYTSIYGADGQRICLMDLEDWGVTEDNQDALEVQQQDIARLISFAPKMLEYLIMAEEELIATHAEGHVQEMLRVLIAEAQGIPS